MAKERHVFISYVREDRDKVDRVQRLLEAAGIPVWRDTADLWPGEDWRIKIREAITANALAFVACFSDNSEEKESTYQHEELLLAIDQIRLRNPAHPWLIPVRLSTCALPQYELGAGRTLDSIQRVDLIGDDWDTGAARLVAGVRRVLPPDAETSGTERPAPSPDDFVKIALLDPTRQIELDDHISAQANSVAQACANPDLFPSTSERLAAGNDGLRFLVEQAKRYWEVVEPLIHSLIPAAAWGQAHHQAMLTRSIERVANVANEQMAGMDALRALRRFPTIPLLYAGGLAALHRQNYGTLRALAVDAEFRDQGTDISIVGSANVWRPFGSIGQTAQLLAFEIAGEELTDGLIEEINSRRRGLRHTPASDYLHDRLRSNFSHLIPDDDAYTAAFDRLEILLGVLAADAKARAAATGTYADGPWFGSFTWRDRRAQKTLEERTQEDLLEQGDGSPILQAGLFGGDLDRAVSAFASFIEGAASARRQRF